MGLIQPIDLPGFRLTRQLTRRNPGQHLHPHHPHGINVAVELRMTGLLLRSHIAQRANDRLLRPRFSIRALIRKIRPRICL